MNGALKNKLILFWLRSVKRLTTPAAMIEFACRRQGDKPLLIEAESGKTTTFAAMRARAGRLAARFRSQLAPGDVLAYVAPNMPEYFEVRAAAHLAGLIFMPLAASLPQETVFYFLDFVKAKGLVYDGELGLPPDRIRQAVGKNAVLDLRGTEYARLVESGPEADGLPVAVAPDDIATYNISSGTTGKIPKVVAISNRAWVSSFYQLMLTAIPAGAGTNRYLCAMPYATAGSTSFLPVLMAGMTVLVVREPFPPATLADAARQYGASRIFLTPSQLYGLLDVCRARNERLPDLAMIVTGTEHASVSLLRECAEWFGPKIVCGYGMVEALPPLTQLPPADYLAPGGTALRETRLRSAGRVVGEIELRTMDEQGRPLPSGTPGRIAVRGDTVCRGYVDNADENAVCFRDGWFLSSDYGRLDDDGFLHVFGRKQDIVGRKADGQPVFASDIEAVFESASCVRRCAAVRPDPDREPVLFIVLRGEAKESEAQAELDGIRAELEPELRPREFLFRTALPATPLGKLDRRTLAEEATRKGGDEGYA